LPFFSGGKPDWLYWIIACIWRVLRRIGACPYKFTQNRFEYDSTGAIAIACGVFRLGWAVCRSGICQKPLGVIVGVTFGVLLIKTLLG
jgi:hypothetical protein